MQPNVGLQPVPDPLPLIREIANVGLKHAHGSAFPIDRMEHCLKMILEVLDGTRTA